MNYRSLILLLSVCVFSLAGMNKDNEESNHPQAQRVIQQFIQDSLAEFFMNPEHGMPLDTNNHLVVFIDTEETNEEIDVEK